MVVTGPNLGESCHARWLHCIAAQWLTASGRERQTVAPHYYIIIIIIHKQKAVGAKKN